MYILEYFRRNIHPNFSSIIKKSSSHCYHFPTTWLLLPYHNSSELSPTYHEMNSGHVYLSLIAISRPTYWGHALPSFVPKAESEAIRAPPPNSGTGIQWYLQFVLNRRTGTRCTEASRELCLARLSSSPRQEFRHNIYCSKSDSSHLQITVKPTQLSISYIIYEVYWIVGYS